MKILPSTIINFHAVGDSRWFESVLKLLLHLYRPVSSEQVYDHVSGRVKHRHSCHLTFDDGHLSFYTTVLPLITRYQVPVSLFLSPEVVESGRNFWFQEVAGFNPALLRKSVEEVVGQAFAQQALGVEALLKLLPVDQIHAVIRHYQQTHNLAPAPRLNINLAELDLIAKSPLVTLGAHTLTHPVLANETDARSRDEIVQSVERLSRLLGRPVTTFAYPNGIPQLDFTQREQESLQQAGIKMAFSTWKRPLSSCSDILAVPRKSLTTGRPLFVAFKLLAGQHYYTLKQFLAGHDEVTQRKNLLKKK